MEEPVVLSSDSLEEICGGCPIVEEVLEEEIVGTTIVPEKRVEEVKTP